MALYTLLQYVLAIQPMRATFTQYLQDNTSSLKIKIPAIDELTYVSKKN